MSADDSDTETGLDAFDAAHLRRMVLAVLTAKHGLQIELDNLRCEHDRLRAEVERHDRLDRAAACNAASELLDPLQSTAESDQINCNS